MPKEAVFTMKLEPELRDAFMAEAAELDRSASQIVRELMRDYVERRKEEREYADFYRRKVKKALAQVKEGKTLSSEEVEAHFATRREEWRKRADEANS